MPIIYVDLRCLQDPGYQFRGIGYHASALLRTRLNGRFLNAKTIGLIDPGFPKLPSEFRPLVDDVTASLNPSALDRGAVFIDPSPMTHDSRFSLRLESHPAVLKAAVLHDFIPLDWPGYLPTVADRIAYLAKIARLKKFDLFFPVSEYTSWRLRQLARIPQRKITVTGTCVRRSLYEIAERSRERVSPYEGERPYFITVGGADRRKNSEVAIRAVQHLNRVHHGRVMLKVLGNYSTNAQRELISLAVSERAPSFVEFCPHLPDDEIVRLHAGAIAAIAPSFIEGFSLPVVESVVCGSPVIASTCAAHLELISRDEALFPSYDDVALARRLDAVLSGAELRHSLLESQKFLAEKFHEDSVSRRFWNTLETTTESDSGYRLRRRPKPKLAFLSPFPPDETGVANYTALTLAGGKDQFFSDLYTDSTRPLAFENGFRDAGPISVAPLVGRYDAIVSVLGNSHFHLGIFDFFERFGGPCILHDSRLTQIYFHRWGEERFLRNTAKFLGRAVAQHEVNQWLQDHDPATLLLEPIIERAAPLIVHTVTQQRIIQERYGVRSEVAPSCPTVFFDREDLLHSRRQAARQRLGIPPDAYLIASFGYASHTKGMVSCILALDFLRSWNIPAELYFVGDAGVNKQEIDRISDLYGVAEHVHCTSGFAHVTTYRDFLLAADSAIQLRTYGFGQLSAALTDTISAGLPCVASADLANSCEAPDYVRRVPDRFSPLQVSEHLASMWEDRPRNKDVEDARASYLSTHNFKYYSERLLQILALS